MMPILVKSDDFRSGRPRLVTACTGVNGLKQNCKTQKQKQRNKVAAIAWIHQILNLFDHELYIFIFFQSRSDCFAERFVSKI